MEEHDKIQCLTPLQHVKSEPDVWGAVNRIRTFSEYVICDGKFVVELIDYSPLWLKIIDEIIVNALDRHVKAPTKVKNIRIDFDIKTGELSVYNDGSSFSVSKHETLVDLYVPQVALCEFLTGSNFKDNRTSSITGGKNGIGAKLTNAFSKLFIIETNDSVKKLYYYQECHDGLTKISPPTIQKWSQLSSDFHKPFTRITFMPDYEAIGYKSGYMDIGEVLYRLLYIRCVFASIYSKANVYLNEIEMPFKSMEDFAINTAGIDPENLICFNMSSTKEKDVYVWEVCIGITEDIGFRHLSIVNGIYTRDGGTHIDYLVSCIIDPHKDKIKSDYNISRWSNNYVTRHLFIFLKSVIPNPSFNSQAKEKLTNPSDFGNMKFSQTTIKVLYTKLKPYLDTAFLVKKQDKETIKKAKVVSKKYERAEMSGTKESAKCSLFIPEGDSAALFIKWGLTEGKKGETKFNGLKYHGIFNIQGKPMNARKEISIKEVGSKSIIIRNDKLKDNERLSSLVAVLGLDYTYKYELNDTGEKEMSKLRYGNVIVAVDQDVDGVGHIFGLILNFFHVFWPSLLKRGFIKRLTTPLIRAYPNNRKFPVISFSDESNYKEWLMANFPTENPKGYKIEYFKGLAAHDKDSAIDIFKKFNTNLYSYVSNNTKTDEMFEVYFGKASDGRKRELRIPLVPYDHSNRSIECVNQLQYETKEFFLSDCERSLPHIIDGLRPAARIVVAGLRKHGGDSLRKLYQMVGDITQSMHYHNGEASLTATCIRLAQTFPGGRNLPYVYGKGNFGSRGHNGANAGSSRYINGMLNKRLVDAMFPMVDDFILEYRYDDGERCEPLYYVPVVPAILLENFTIPGTGWKSSIWARDAFVVIDNVRRCIIGEPMKSMPYWNTNNRSQVFEHDNKILLVGEVMMSAKSDNIIYITEMPFGVWHDKWREDMLDPENPKSELIDDIINNSNDSNINITVKLKPAAADKMPTGMPNVDYLTEFLMIYTKGTHHYNCLGADNCVYEAKDYIDMFVKWYAKRKECYAIRIDRRIIILKHLIILLEMMIRYANNYVEYNLSRKSYEVATEILSKNNYIMLNENHIENPKYIPLDELDAFMMQNASYNYLLNLSDMDKLAPANARREAKLAEYKAELEELKKEDKYFKGASIWLKEIDILEECIRDGFAKGWGYGKDKVIYE